MAVKDFSKNQSEVYRYFSLAKPYTINGVTYQSAVCYPIRDGMLKLLQTLPAGDAVLYTEQMTFVNGIPVSVSSLKDFKRTSQGITQKNVVNVPPAGMSVEIGSM